MSLDKAIKYGKEHRKEYRGGKSFDKECRNHGACEICLSNRTICLLRYPNMLFHRLESAPSPSLTDTLTPLISQAPTFPSSQ